MFSNTLCYVRLVFEGWGGGGGGVVQDFEQGDATSFSFFSGCADCCNYNYGILHDES